jgi:prepilin-type N-terminal cleavage/methylation domain-containing protein
MTRQRGFTLIEAVVVILILSIAAVAVLGQFTQASRAWSVDEDLQVATQLVQERMEGILALRRASGYAAVAVGTTNDTLTGNYAAYGRTVTVSNLAGAPCPAASCKQVVVSVSRAGTPLASATLLLASY